MSKEEEARVRDELLQGLYAGVLRVRLAESRSPSAAGSGAARSGGEAVAAGLGANLGELDLVALPRRGGAALRLLRGAGAAGQSSYTGRDLQAGLLTLPQTEAAAVALVLGAAAAALHGTAGAVVVALLPPSAEVGGAALPATRVRTAARDGRQPETWAALGSYAARYALPLLFVSDGLAGVAGGAPEQPAPAFPTIPVDRDDALAAYRVAFECIRRARLGGGPSHLAGVPFRLRRGSAAEPDALTRLETTLRARGAFGASWRHGLERRLIRELSGA